MADKELLDKFLEQLELIGIEIDEKISELEENDDEVELVKSIIEHIQFSKIFFVECYQNMPKGGKKEFQELLLKVLKDREVVDIIVQEMVNLYFLSSSGLVDLEEAQAQKEDAYKTLNSLCKTLENYYEELLARKEKSDKKRLEDRLEKIVRLGTALEEQDNMQVADIDFLEEMLELSNLSDEEKQLLLVSIISMNEKTYRRVLKNKKTGVITAMELTKDELSSIIGTRHEEEVLVDANTVARLDELLSNPQVIKQITLILNINVDENIDTTSKRFQDLVDSSVAQVRDALIEKLSNDDTLTPEEALDEFIKEKELGKQSKLDILRDMLKDGETTDLDQAAQQEVIFSALAFYTANRNLLNSLDEDRKEQLSEYIVSIFNDIKNRDIIYHSESFSRTNEVEKMAVYEIEIIKRLMEGLDENQSDYHIMLSKICKRFEDIMRCLYLTIKEQEKEASVHK